MTQRAPDPSSQPADPPPPDASARTTAAAVDVRDKTWLASLWRAAREGWEAAGPVEAPPEVAQGGEAWVAWSSMRCEHLHEATTEAIVTRGPDGLAQALRLAVLEADARMGLDAAALLSGGPTALWELNLAVGFAVTAAQWPALTVLLERRDSVRPGEAIDLLAERATRRAIREIGDAHRQRILPDGHPLLGRSFARLVDHSDTRLFARVAWRLHRGSLDLEQARFLQRSAAAERRAALEAIIGLVHADGRVDKRERRLVREQIRLAGLDKADREHLEQALDAGLADPMDLAGRISTDVDRPWIVRQAAFMALVDGIITPEEQAYLTRLATALRVPPEAVATIQDEVAEAFGAAPEIRGSLTMGAALDRQRRALQKRVERVVRNNLDALVGEVRDTGDLMQLLAASTRRPLTPEESARMKAQLLDVAKTIPALAIFAAPGGALLLPVLAKVLPFSILPSRFED